MRNKLKSYLSILFCFFLLSKSVNSNEPFIFDVTEIEILEDGNQINGYKVAQLLLKMEAELLQKIFFITN